MEGLRATYPAVPLPNELDMVCFVLEGALCNTFCQAHHLKS